jgi:hypothetical protein
MGSLPFTTTVSPQTTASLVRHSLAGDTTSDADLLILDQALSEIAPIREEDQEIDPLAIQGGDEQEGSLELALAAAFDEEIDWRFGF